MEQKRAPMDKNRIRGLCLRASWQRAVKPISTKASGGKSGGGALKTVELTAGDLAHVVDSRLEKKRFFLIVHQRSAEGKVVSQRGTKAGTIGAASKWHNSRVHRGRRTS